MKVMLDKQKVTKDQIVRFIEEAQVTGQLEHPNIVPVHELSVNDSGNPYYTMKMIKGVTLKEILKRISEKDKVALKLYPLTRLLNIFIQACNGVAYAHSKGVIHRDLKPENIMIGEYGEVLVVDWGLAKIIGNKEITKASSGSEEFGHLSIESLRYEDESQRTMAGQAMGTPLFMSPEQAQDASSVNHLSDIYSMGAVLYNILTLNTPVKGKNLANLLMNVVAGKIENPLTYNTKKEAFLEHCPGGKIPAALASVTMKALANKKEDRYQRMEEFQNDLQSYLDGYATVAEEATLWRQIVLLVNRNKPLFIGASVAIFIIFCIVIVALVNINKEKKIAEQNALDAKNNALTAEQNALRAENNAKVADEARVQAEQFQKTAERSTYLVSINLAQQYIKNGDLKQARKVLKSCSENRRHFEWYYLNNIANPKPFMTLSHDDKVTSVDFAQNNQLILTASLDKTVKLWMLNNPNPIKVINVGNKIINARFNYDYKLFFTIRENNETKIWSVQTGQNILTLTGHKAKVTDAVFSKGGKYIITASLDKTVKIWDLQNGSLFKSYETANPITALAVSSDDKFIACATGTNSNNHSFTLLDFQTGNFLKKIDIKGAPAWATKIKFSNNNKMVVYCRQVYSLTNYALLAGITNQDPEIIGYHFTADDKTLLLIHTDGLVKTLDITKNECIEKTDLNVEGITAFSTNAQGDKLLLGTNNTVILKEKNANLQTSKNLLSLKKNIYRSVLNKNKDKIIYISQDSIEYFDFRKKTSVWKIPRNDAQWLDIKPDNSEIFCGGWSSSWLINPEDGKIKNLDFANGHIVTCKYSPDGQYLAVGTKDKGFMLLETSTFKEILKTKGNGIYTVDFTKDGKLLATGNYDNEATIYDMQQKKIIQTYKHEAGVVKVYFHPKENILVTCTTQGDLFLWDLSTNKIIKKVSVHSGIIKDIIISSDCKRIVTCAADQSIKIWDAETFEQLVTLTGHESDVRDVHFIDNDKNLLSDGYDGFLKLWEGDDSNSK